MIRGREALRGQQHGLVPDDWAPNNQRGRELATRWLQYIGHMKLYDKEVPRLTCFKADMELCGIEPGATFMGYRIEAV